jgi:glycosyltransferase involved in cell wall biosynthesis
LAARVTRKIICVSKFDRELGLKFRIACPEKLVVIHNGMPPAPYLDLNKKNSLFIRGPNMRRTPTLMTVGRLAPPKDFETLLGALQRLDNIKTIIVGDGPSRRWVERYINNNGLSQKVSLLGEREDIPDLLGSAEIFVLSSKKEGLPRTIIEAMLSGLPVVATRVGGVPELVEDNTTGFLVPPGNSQALATALQGLIKDRGLRRAMGEAGREKALKEFSLDRMLKETLRVYEEVLQ